MDASRKIINNMNNIWKPCKEEKELALKRIIETRDANQHFFEKHFTYIVAGLIAILLTMFSDIRSLNFRYSFVFSFSFFALSLLLNLYSYIRAVNFADENIDDIKTDLFNKVEYEKGAEILKFINHLSLIMVMIGICFLIRFVFMNIK